MSDSADGRDGIARGHPERPEQHQELSDKPVCGGEGHGREHDDQRQGRKARHQSGDPAVVIQLPRVGAVVKHPHEQKQPPGA